jgi:hypothetical protein
MNSFDSKKYYTITPMNPKEASWQPDAVINNKILAESGITSNWKYRQYIQNNANHIMKYDSMEYIYASGNNPYFDESNPLTKQSEPLTNVPYKFSSMYDPSYPNYGFSNSDLKQDFLKRQQMSSRMISPAYATINPK